VGGDYVVGIFMSCGIAPPYELDGSGMEPRRYEIICTSPYRPWDQLTFPHGVNTPWHGMITHPYPAPRFNNGTILTRATVAEIYDSPYQMISDDDININTI
jgi:hypothetical protein